MRTRNLHSHAVLLPEQRDAEGQLHSAVAVEPGEALDWPIPIAGFELAEPDRPAKKTSATTETETTGPTAKAVPTKEAAA